MDEGRGVALSVSLAWLLGPLALLAWATGLPFLLPSLGPSAYVLATRIRPWRAVSREVALGQTVGVVVAYLAVRALVGPLTGVALLPHTVAGLRQVAAVVVAVVAATLGMSALDARHAPAYATVLIFALGIPAEAVDVLVFLGGVAVLLALDALRVRGVALAPRGR
ncbi:HPP family protein [Halarchaeum sp. CBA1220]|uniref:HPP family protein n=1 Tax=Halarchaeum sp. CBA1220 TaxID=1853682 RepID=UPI000F3A8B4C|nr:HPP family protein [Halarchaeum sp. CBA1220]QLC32983.1 HPP family protein [Halarchaeum sp. CBA1220]